MGTSGSGMQQLNAGSAGAQVQECPHASCISLLHLAPTGASGPDYLQLVLVVFFYHNSAFPMSSNILVCLQASSTNIAKYRGCIFVRLFFDFFHASFLSFTDEGSRGLPNVCNKSVIRLAFPQTASK